SSPSQAGAGRAAAIRAAFVRRPARPPSTTGVPNGATVLPAGASDPDRPGSRAQRAPRRAWPRAGRCRGAAARGAGDRARGARRAATSCPARAAYCLRVPRSSPRRPSAPCGASRPGASTRVESRAFGSGSPCTPPGGSTCSGHDRAAPEAAGPAPHGGPAELLLPPLPHVQADRLDALVLPLPDPELQHRLLHVAHTGQGLVLALPLGPDPIEPGRYALEEPVVTLAVADPGGR